MTLTAADLAKLAEIDTPTICNALEVVAPGRRALGFNREPLVCPFPDRKPIVGYARTATIRSREAHPNPAEAKAVRMAYYEYIAAGPKPTIALLQDVDGPDRGIGAFWGEVQTNVHAALGCLGVITDGSVRDLEQMHPNFFVLAGSVMPSHLHVHAVDFGKPVSIAGMMVASDDLVHADRHGAVVIPKDLVAKVFEAVDLLTRKEKVVLDATRSGNFSIETLRKAFEQMDEIH